MSTIDTATSPPEAIYFALELVDGSFKCHPGST